MEYGQYRLSPKEKRDCVIISGVALFLASYIFYQNLVLSLLFCALAPLTLKKWSEFFATRRRDALSVQFKDLLYSLSASFASGRQMREALAEAREDLSILYGDKGYLVTELSAMLVSMNESGVFEEEVLQDFARRSASEDIRSFIEVYLICRSTGADVERVIAKAVETLGDKMAIDREIKTLTAQKRFEGRMISAMPLVIILFLNLVSPAYLEVLYTSIPGRMIMTAALAGIAYASNLISKMTKVEV